MELLKIDTTELIQDLGEKYETSIYSRKLVPNVKTVMYGVKKKVEDKYSQVIVLSSMKANGMGKSALLYWIAKYVMGDRFSFRKHFFFYGGKKEIEEQTDKLAKGSILCMDEMVRMAYSRQAMSKKVIDLNIWLAADQRKTGVILAGAIPDFWMLDSYLRGGKVDIYIEILARGIGVVFRADRFPKTDPWHEEVFDRLIKARGAAGKHERIEQKIEILKNHPCYDGLIFWNAMPKEAEEEYIRMVEESRLKANQELAENEVDKAKREFYEKQGELKLKSQLGLINLVKSFETRGVRRSDALKLAGVEAAAYEKILKDYNKETKKEEAAVPPVIPNST